MIKWIFFDIGNVILNDDPLMAFFYNEIYGTIKGNGNQVTLDQVLAAREHFLLEERSGRPYVDVALKFLEREIWSKHEVKIRKMLSENWQTLCPLIPGIVPVIEKLAVKFNLGIIANQPNEAGPVLEKHGLLKYFKVHGISQSVGLSKPDPKLFQWAIDEANCEPEEGIMIGDRIDNDVIPAKSVGLKTLWLKLPMALKNYDPTTEFEKKYFESLGRASASLVRPVDETGIPHAQAEDFDSILSEIARLTKECLSENE